MSDLPVPPNRRTHVLVYALNRWQTLVVVLVALAGVAASVAFAGASLALILLSAGFGVVGTLTMVLVSFRDAESIDEALHSNVDVNALQDKRLRQKVLRAEAYLRALRQAIRGTNSPELRSSLELLTQGDTDPVGLVYTLARRLEAYQSDRLIQEDLRQLQARRTALVPEETEQLATLEKLQHLMGETALSIDGALAQLGASYSAVQLALSSGELKGSNARHAIEDLRQQSTQLHDLNASLDEVYAERGRLTR